MLYHLTTRLTLALSDGKFPATLEIKGIKQIKVFSHKQQSAENAVITGLTIEYDGVTSKPVSHGVVVAVDLVGTVTIDPGMTINFDLHHPQHPALPQRLITSLAFLDGSKIWKATEMTGASLLLAFPCLTNQTEW